MQVFPFFLRPLTCQHLSFLKGDRRDHLRTSAGKHRRTEQKVRRWGPAVSQHGCAGGFVTGRYGLLGWTVPDLWEHGVSHRRTKKRAQPAVRRYSNLEFTISFRHPSRLSDHERKCLSDLSSAFRLLCGARMSEQVAGQPLWSHDSTCEKKIQGG